MVTMTRGQTNDFLTSFSLRSERDHLDKPADAPWADMDRPVRTGRHARDKTTCDSHHVMFSHASAPSFQALGCGGEEGLGAVDLPKLCTSGGDGFEFFPALIECGGGSTGFF
jgi:hypothetical protein